MASTGVKNVEVHGDKLRITFFIGGKRCRETLPLEPTKANITAAAKRLTRIEGEIARGVFDRAKEFPDSRSARSNTPHPGSGDHAKKTFKAACEAYEKTLSMKPPATRSQYGNALKIWRGLFGDDTPVLEIEHDRIAEVIGGTPWKSGKLLNNYLIPLRGVFSMQYRGRKSIDNPMIGIDNVPVTQKLPDPLTTEERDAILADMYKRYDVRVAAYFEWQFATGMRIQETIALRWEDIDERSGVARIRRVRTFKGSEREDTKTKTFRDVVLTPAALKALSIMKPYTKMKSTDVFEHPETRAPWHDDRAQRDTYWKPTLRRLGIRYRRAYATRHTCATAALMAGVNPAFLAVQLGHSVAVLLKVYSRWMRGSQDQAQIALLAAATATPSLDTAGYPVVQSAT